MNKYRLMKVTVDGCTHYEIQKNDWFVWETIDRKYIYSSAIARLKELNHIPIITREVINIEK